MNYDEKIKQLEQISSELEKDIPLTEALEKYNKGVALIKECVESLDSVKGSITKVKQDLDSYIEEKMR